MAGSDLERLREENEELRRRIERADIELAQLRTDAIERRRELRRLVEGLPAATSRRALVRALLGDLAGPFRRLLRRR